ncbi:MAG: SprT-like domain-containing protein [Candidatus Zixiibacteriota bacterium]|nr:MAG: SprT-like domain-containing protein [candidate division Zixibacteria bacterium]
MARRKTQRKALRALNYDMFRPENVAPPPPATIDTKIKRHTERQPSAALELPVPGAGKLPQDNELYRMYDLYNWLYFGGKLPRVSIEYSGRMTSAGSYSWHNKCIRISRKYHEIFPDEISDTLKHEMLHIKHHRHDAAFKKEAARIGASVRAKRHPLLERSPRYVYICPKCRSEYPRQKRLRMASCGDCSRGGRFDPRYKLVLIRSIKRSQK